MKMGGSEDEPEPSMAAAEPKQWRRFEFDALLGFSGSDPRGEGFAGRLLAALKQHGVRTPPAVDVPENKRVTALPDVEASQVFLPIISESYADSGWRLSELAKMVASACGGRVILPVFLGVDPSDVRRQRGPFEAAFQRLEEESRAEEKSSVSEWRDAMKEVGEIVGYVVDSHADDRNAAKLVQVIVKRVLSVIAGTTLDLTEHLIGIDSRVQQVLKLLKLSAPDVRIIGIHGMAGIGKTTLSKAIYNTISHQFQGRSFISNIREVSKHPNGLVSLQNQLIHDIFKGKIQPVRGVSQGTSIMKQRFHTKPILIVLDDVDDKKQLDALVGERDWFCAGTRIIITTRDEHILNILNLQQEPKWCQIYTVERLSRIQSLQLLSHHAFRKDWPLEEYMKLSEEVVSLLAGLPLSLEVFGSFLFDKRRTKEWEDVLDNLKQIEPDDVQSTLKLSYDQLDEAEKCLFLDVASFFIGIDKDSAIHAWKDCGLFPYIGIKVLEHKSLLSINEKNNVIEMHDQLRDMGRQIIMHESPLEPGKRSRLWSHDEILHLLNDRKGTESVESITLNFKDVKKRGKKTYLKAQAFAAMPNLRLLRLNYAKIQGAYEDFPRRLKWLEWQGCPLESLPCNFNLEEIAVLDLCKSRICQVLKKQVRQTNKGHLHIFDKLKVLNLSHLDHLTVTPDLANFPKLVRLVLEGCCKLVTIHESIRKLIDLVILNMSDCKELVKLPHHICHLKSLKVLMLSCCSKLDTLPKRLGDLESLTDLVLDGTAVKVLPKSVVQLSNLCRLSLNMCESLKELPDSIGSLHSLEVLILDCTSIRRIPDSIGSLEKLQKLSARNCMSLVSLPNSIGNARSLIKLLLDGTCIVELPNSVGLLDQLQVLSVSDCMNLTSLPECMGKLTSLCRLKMQNTSISYLPEDVSLLVNLHTFDMELCAINRLPQNFGSLSNLRVLNLRGNSNLEKLSPTFSLLRSLQELDLSKCNLSNGVIPNDFGCLSSLKFLMLDYNDFCSLPSSIGDLSALKTLYLRYCQELQSLPQLPASLTFLDISCCNTLERVDLTNLVSLQTLYLSDCEGLLNVCGLEKMKVLRLLHIRGCGNLDSATKDSLVKETFGLLEVFEISGVQASDHQLSIWLPNTSKPKLKVVEAILSLDVTFNRLILPIVRIQVTIMSGDEEVYGITSSFRWATKNSDYGTYCFRCQENDPMLDHIQDGDWIRVSIERIPWCRELQVNKCYIYIAYRPRETPGLLDFFLEENPDFQDHVFTTRELLEYTSSDDESVSW